MAESMRGADKSMAEADKIARDAHADLVKALDNAIGSLTYYRNEMMSGGVVFAKPELDPDRVENDSDRLNAAVGVASRAYWHALLRCKLLRDGSFE